jgi:hypothetical protein
LRGRYRYQDGREHARHFDRKIDAQRWLDGVTASQVRGDYVDPRLGRTRMSDYVGLWLPAQPLRDTSRPAYDSYLRNHVLPAFGDQRLSAVTRTQVLAFRRQLEERLAPITARQVMVMLAGIFADAVPDGVLARSPCADTVPRRPPRRRVVPPTADGSTRSSPQHRRATGRWSSSAPPADSGSGRRSACRSGACGSRSANSTWCSSSSWCPVSRRGARRERPAAGRPRGRSHE